MGAKKEDGGDVKDKAHVLQDDMVSRLKKKTNERYMKYHESEAMDDANNAKSDDEALKKAVRVAKEIEEDKVTEEESGSIFAKERSFKDKLRRQEDHEDGDEGEDVPPPRDVYSDEHDDHDLDHDDGYGEHEDGMD